ncbi:hypothetical protein C8J57DRAFT_1529928 [Mycena rebaudengoi]|nr:hypothetical protein C8J57DRAFT_1529928 [Mycena rebaudengoi]
MPTVGQRKVLLDEIYTHHQNVIRQCHQCRTLDVMSDLSSDSEASSVGNDARSDISAPSDISDMTILSPDSLDVEMLSPMSSASHSDASSSESDSCSPSDVEDEFYLCYEQRYHALIHEIETTRVLEPGPPVPKVSPLPLLDHFRQYSIDHWHRKLRYCTLGWNVIGGVDKCTDRVRVAILAFHHKAVGLPNAAEKELTKVWVEKQSCTEWQDGFMVVDGSKIPFYHCPGLHGDTWFNKDNEYSIDIKACAVFANRAQTHH